MGKEREQEKEKENRDDEDRGAEMTKYRKGSKRGKERAQLPSLLTIIQS